jgi:hypothetical protein
MYNVFNVLLKLVCYLLVENFWIYIWGFVLFCVCGSSSPPSFHPNASDETQALHVLTVLYLYETTSQPNIPSFEMKSHSVLQADFELLILPLLPK